MKRSYGINLGKPRDDEITKNNIVKAYFKRDILEASQ